MRTFEKAFFFFFSPENLLFSGGTLEEDDSRDHRVLFLPLWSRLSHLVPKQNKKDWLGGAFYVALCSRLARLQCQANKILRRGS